MQREKGTPLMSSEKEETASRKQNQGFQRKWRGGTSKKR
jgi:hypothetical protein